MEAYEAVTLVMDANGGAINGRTAIQKLVYLCATRVGSIDISSYKHYFYGPFSRKVASALIDMSAFSYINETFSLQFGGYKYDFTERGKKLAESVSGRYENEREQIGHIVDTCKDFDRDLRPSLLSFAAKSHYILANAEDKKGEYTKDDVRRVGREFDWDISREDVDAGVELLERLNLVKVKRVQT